MLPRPTDGELMILQVLWDRGSATVRQVHEVLLPEHKTGYTTVLKLLQIMTEKGLVVRDESERTHVYSAAQSRESTQRQLLRDLANKAFGGSAQNLVLQALNPEVADAGELQEIKKLLQSKKGGTT